MHKIKTILCAAVKTVLNKKQWKMGITRCKVGVEWVIALDVLNSNSMLYYYIQKNNFELR